MNIFFLEKDTKKKKNGVCIRILRILNERRAGYLMLCSSSTYIKEDGGGRCGG